VFPSFAETFGMVTLESMAMQKPVVNSSIGWAQELIDDGEHGYLIHPTETQAYVNSIIKLFNDKSLCAKIGAAARQKAERYFNSDDIAVKTIAFYQSIISETPS
jgi:glycosyltransferase involved in cell wall biosynthesis